MSENPENTSDSGEQDATTTPPAKPFLEVIDGNPDATQVAAITTLFAVMANNAAAQDAAEKDRNRWGDVEERLRKPVTYNPNAFRNVTFY